MSFFIPAQNYLVPKLECVFDNEGVVDMIGGAATGTSYSLAGHVLLSICALPQLLEKRLREVKELLVEVEGKSEFFDEHGRYTPLRIWSETFRIDTPSESLLIPAQDQLRPGSSKVQTAVTFDLRLPGWLPPTHSSQMTRTQYGVVVHAVVGWAEPPSYDRGEGSSTMPLDPSFRYHTRASKPSKTFDGLFHHHSLQPTAREKVKSKYREFEVRRHRMPSAMGCSDAFERHYTLKPNMDTLNPVECVISVPDWVDSNAEDKTVRISMRLRARKGTKRCDPEARGEGILPDESVVEDVEMQDDGGIEQAEDTIPQEMPVKRVEKPLMYMLELGMEVEETERYSATPFHSFSSQYPISAHQPSRGSHPFISPRPLYAIDALLATTNEPFRGFRSRSCLLTDDGVQRNFFFADQGLALGEQWRKVNIMLPMPTDTERQRANRPQPEVEGPYLKVKHALRIRMVCRDPGGSANQVVVVLSVPIRFGTGPSTMPSSRTSALPPLPAYIQLFHENGDLRQCDPLPLYTRDVDVAADDEITPELSPPKPEPDLLPAFQPDSPGSQWGTPPALSSSIANRRSAMGLTSLVTQETEGGARGGDPRLGSTTTESLAPSSSSGSAALGGMDTDMSSAESSSDSEVEGGVMRPRESRSAAPPPTPRTPGGRKAVRMPRGGSRAVAA